MTRALSLDLRDRIARYVLAGHSRRAAAKVFDVSVSSAIRFVALYQARGTLAPLPQGGDRRSKLGAHGAYVLDPVTRRQTPHALLTILYRSTHRRCRAGAAV